MRFLPGVPLEGPRLPVVEYSWVILAADNRECLPSRSAGRSRTPGRAAAVSGIVAQFPLREIGVGKADDRVILLAHPCRAQADRLDRAVLVAKAAEVADPDRLVREQRQTPDDVLEPWPDGEGDGKSADAKAGDTGVNGIPKKPAAKSIKATRVARLHSRRRVRTSWPSMLPCFTRRASLIASAMRPAVMLLSQPLRRTSRQTRE